MKKELSIYLSTTITPVYRMSRDEFIKHARIYDWTDEALRRYKMLKTKPAVVDGNFSKPLDISVFINKPSFSEYVRGLSVAYNDKGRYDVSRDVGFITVLHTGLEHSSVWDVLVNGDGLLDRMAVQIDDINWMEYDDKAVRVCEVCIGASRLNWAESSRCVVSDIQKGGNLAWDLMGSFNTPVSDMQQWLLALNGWPVGLYDTIANKLTEMSKFFGSACAGAILSRDCRDSERDAVVQFITSKPTEVVEAALTEYTRRTSKSPLVELWNVISDAVANIPVTGGSDGLLRDLCMERNGWFWCAMGLPRSRLITVKALVHFMKISRDREFQIEVCTRYWLDREHNVRIYLDGERQVGYGSRADYDLTYDVMGTGTILDYILNPTYTAPGVIGSAYDFLASAPAWVNVSAVLSGKPANENEI